MGRKRGDWTIIEGQTFGLWTVKSIPGGTRQVTQRVLCKCECGTEREAVIANLLTGKSLSCGCMPRLLLSQRLTTHSKSKTPEYKIWIGIKKRCFNPNSSIFQYYGGRGISVCKTWKDSFEAFLRDMGPRPSLGHSVDRRNNNGNYEPGNCYWATDVEQNSNTNRNVYVVIDGERKTITEWSRVSGVDRKTISRRIEKGVAPEIAVFSKGYLFIKRRT